MYWPIPSDYQQAVQNPRNCFGDPELQAGYPVAGLLGLPRVASGKNASVYQIRNNGRTWAVRCFVRHVTDEERRYRLVSQHFASAAISSRVGFAYQPQGIQLQGTWFPLVKMEWAEGEPLHAYVEGHLNKNGLLDLASRWRRLAAELKGAHVAHGDLQHGNILVSNRTFWLVDYDGVFVPALRGEESPEMGHPNYQHPGRHAEDFSEDLDHFSALVIYLSLLALASDPDLWKSYHAGENLILSAVDYREPGRSEVFQRLRQSNEAEVRDLAGRLMHYCKQPLAIVPDLETILAAASTSNATPTRWWETQPMPHQRPPQSWTSVASTPAALPVSPQPAPRSQQLAKPLPANAPPRAQSVQPMLSSAPVAARSPVRKRRVIPLAAAGLAAVALVVGFENWRADTTEQAVSPSVLVPSDELQKLTVEVEELKQQKSVLLNEAKALTAESAHLRQKSDNTNRLAGEEDRLSREVNALTAKLYQLRQEELSLIREIGVQRAREQALMENVLGAESRIKTLRSEEERLARQVQKVKEDASRLNFGRNFQQGNFDGTK